jgi:hypothetical protein
VKEPEAYTLLACYAASLASWLDASEVPIRVGTPGRSYRQFRRHYLRLVSKGNDHLCVVARPEHGNLAAIRYGVRESLDDRRRNSVNCDKIRTVYATTKPTEPPGLFTFGPLGNFTAAASADRRIESVPRPLWGLASFGQAAAGDLKIGLFTFREGSTTRVHVHGNGVSEGAFLEFADLLASNCRDAGLEAL